ncbi:MAG TPA: DNA alkylation repair protein [Acidimicrobiales bacterium]
MTTWPHEILRRTKSSLEPLANSNLAPMMRAYMKDVAPFLGIRAGERRRALRNSWHGLNPPTCDELGEACLTLVGQREREFSYAAYDLIARFIDAADETFLIEYMQDLLVTKPWWDTVDGLGSAGVSPLCRRYDARTVVAQWSKSGDRWLIRAAIQHQRGWKHDTDVEYVLELCDEHAHSREFFVAKAIGWALRDLARLDSRSVDRFLREHPDLSPVAAREARRGLSTT